MKELIIEDDFWLVFFNFFCSFEILIKSSSFLSNISFIFVPISIFSCNKHVISLSYVSLEQEFAKQFVENLINEMSIMYIDHQTAQANHTLDFLQDRADSVFAELEVAEQDFARVKDSIIILL